MVARWSSNPLGMLSPEMDAAFVMSGGGDGPAGDCYRCGLKLGEGILLQLSVAQDPAGNLKPAKDKSTERIDGIVAAIMAIGRALVTQEERHVEYSMFFV